MTQAVSEHATNTVYT